MNWSIVLNVLLLVVVIGAIIRTFNLRRAQAAPYLEPSQPLNAMPTMDDDIIAVRKINQDCQITPPTIQVDSLKDDSYAETDFDSDSTGLPGPNVVMFLSAKDNKQFKGYELLQTLLTSGLRFGEGNLFHRHHDSYGQGPIMCSVAAATESGTFDLQNMDALNIKGLCIFMQGCRNANIDAERFDIMTKTAKQLAHHLDAHWLSQDRQPMTPDLLHALKKTLGLREQYV